jgi:hypothetical protein
LRHVRDNGARACGKSATFMFYQLREPVLHATPLIELRPTQMTLGMREVVMKQASWKERDSKDLEKFLGSHMVPVIVGPGQQKYLIDHHHLARALHEIGVKSVFVTVVTDLHKLEVATFWNMMDYHGWTHPFDAKGRRCDYAELPATVEDMHDDPYRSLAGELRRIGGFAKDSTPYSEFVWADFLRLRIKPKAVKQDFSGTLAVALDMARSEEASYLPGWCAPHAKAAAMARRDEEGADKAKKTKREKDAKKESDDS